MVLSVIVALSLCQGVSRDGQQPASLFEQVVGTPTGANGYEEFVRAADIVASDKVQALLKDMPPVGSKDWLERRRAVSDACLNAFELVHKGLDKPSHYPKQDATLWSPFPELQKFKQVTTAMTCRAAVACADGHPDAAANTLADGFRLAARVSESFAQLQYLVGRNMNFVLMREFDRDRYQFTPVGFKSLSSAVQESLDQKNTLVNAMSKEKQQVDQLAAALIDDPQKAFSVLGVKLGVKEPDFQVNESLRSWPSKSSSERISIGRVYMAWVDKGFDRFIQLIGGNESAWLGANLDKDEAPDIPEVPLVGDWLGSLQAIVNIEAEQRTRLRLVRLHCAVLQYRWQRNALPSTIEGLDTQIGTVDPQTGKPFHYLLKGKRYELSAERADGKGFFDLTTRGIQSLDKASDEGPPPSMLRESRGHS